MVVPERLGDRGAPLWEIAALAAVLALATGVAAWRLKAGPRHIESAHRELVANLRLCRTQAVADGYHCEVAVTSPTSYRVERMLPPETPARRWTVDMSSSRDIRLPVGVTLSQAAGTFEFDSRGSLVNMMGRTPLTLTDSGYNWQKRVVLWPSGQVDAG
jgi:Tfp pilus assembly protein FimT